MMLIKRFFRRIIKDFRHKELLPLKVIFFVQASTLHVLYPYLTIHMRELGINVEETAIMSAVTPFVALVMPPIAGMLADRIGNFKMLLSLFSSLGGLAALLLLLVPIGRITVQYPSRVVMDLGCPSHNGELIYTMTSEHTCVAKLRNDITTRIESCGYVCQIDVRNRTDIDIINQAREYTAIINDLKTGKTVSYVFTASQFELPPNSMDRDKEIRETRKLKNNEFYQTSIRRLSKDIFYFPTRGLYEFSCSNIVNDTNPQLSCAYGRFMDLSEHNASHKTNYRSYTSKLNLMNPNDQNEQQFLTETMTWDVNEEKKQVTCPSVETKTLQVDFKLPLINYTESKKPYEIIQVKNCEKRCIVTAPRKDMCSNKNTIIEYNIRLTFWLYLGIRVFIGMIGGTAFAMFEGAVIAILREEEADYGLQRIYGSIGGMISSPLSGLLIDYASTGKGYTDFRPAFYLYAALKLMSGLLMLMINLEFKAPASDVFKDVVNVLKNIEMTALFIACFILGTAWGYIESFLFWLIQDLGGSRSLMGITITVGGIAGIPLLVLSGPIISKIGHANVLFVGFVFYAVRLIGYSVITSAWQSLIFEALESVTTSLSFTAAVTYAAKLSTTTTDSSIQGLLGGLYYGVGKGAGSLIGGYLMKAFGTRPTYRIFAVITLATGLVYFFFNLGYLKKRPQIEGNDIVKKKPKSNEQKNGIELGSKEKECIRQNGFDNVAFSQNEDERKIQTDNEIIEAINNSKNLDKIERMPCENDKKSSKRKNQKIKESKKSVDNRMKCSTNKALEKDEVIDNNCCKVTVEKTPEDVK